MPLTLPPDATAAARIRARRRLVGAVVLLGAGVVAFPLLFETQPRPIPVDIPIEVPRKDRAPPLAVPPVGSAATAAAASAAEGGREDIPPSLAADAPGTKTVAPAPSAAPKVPVAKPAQSSAPTSGDGMRFVVQVGAFSDAAAARETRSKVEKAGLKTYTQVAETPSGNRTRVRIGPFSSRDEAERALGKAKAAGVDGVVLTL